jgi:hypothetical protein
MSELMVKTLVLANVTTVLRVALEGLNLTAVDGVTSINPTNISTDVVPSD